MSKENQIKRLKKVLADGNFESLKSFLASDATADDLQVIREQKLLMTIRDPEGLKQLTKAYKGAAVRQLSAELAPRATMYVDFVRLVSGMFCHFNDESSKLLRAFTHISLLDLLEIAEGVMAEVTDHFHKEFSPQFLSGIDNPDTAAVANTHEHTLQMLSARLTDTLSH